MGKQVEKSGLRNIFALSFVSFFTDVSSEMCFGVLPTFVLDELKASRFILGLIEGFAEWFSYSFRMFSGVISDKIGKRKLLVSIGYSLSTAIKPFFAFARSWIDVLAVRLGDRIGKGVRQAPRDTLLSESVTEKHLGKAFGLHRTLDQLGAIIGPIIAFILIPLFGIRGIFLFSLLPSLIAVLILLIFVQEIVKKKAEKPSIMVNLKKVINKNFMLLLTLMAIFSIGAFNFSFILAKARTLGVPETVVPLVYAIINVTHTIIGIPAGMLSDKIGGEKTLIIGYLTFTFSAFLCMILQESPFYAFLIAAIYGVYMGVAEVVQRAMIPRYVPAELKATAYGLYYITVGTCFFVANTLIGFLLDLFGEIAFLYSVVTALIAVVGMLIFIKGES